MIPGVSSSMTTSCKAVLPFYFYAALSFVVASLLLVFHTSIFSLHHFQPATLAITHIMALGWGTMIILGASHQLLPVLTSGVLYSDTLALISFGCAAIGIPLLIAGFYYFFMGITTIAGAVLINFATLFYLVNILNTCRKSKGWNVQSLFIFTATAWLFVTSLVGLLLVSDFTLHILPHNSLYYLSLHAHLGIIGWFLLFVIGAGSRLIPMFMISKYNNSRLLYWSYSFINAGLLLFVFTELYEGISNLVFVPVIFILVAIAIFVFYICRAFISRLRRQVDAPLQVSLIAVLMMLLPPLTILILLLASSLHSNSEIIHAYGFSIFFGWITSIIFGMTFKTLPFIVWNRVYHSALGRGKIPSPKDLFSNVLVRWMKIFYLSGFLGFICGILSQLKPLMQVSSLFIAVSGMFYFINVVTIIMHKPVTS